MSGIRFVTRFLILVLLLGMATAVAAADSRACDSATAICGVDRPDRERPDKCRPDKDRPDRDWPDKCRPDKDRPDKDPPRDSCPDKCRPDKYR